MLPHYLVKTTHLTLLTGESTTYTTHQPAVYNSGGLLITGKIIIN